MNTYDNNYYNMSLCSSYIHVLHSLLHDNIVCINFTSIIQYLYIIRKITKTLKKNRDRDYSTSQHLNNVSHVIRNNHIQSALHSQHSLICKLASLSCCSSYTGMGTTDNNVNHNNYCNRENVNQEERCSDISELQGSAQRRC